MNSFPYYLIFTYTSISFLCISFIANLIYSISNNKLSKINLDLKIIIVWLTLLGMSIYFIKFLLIILLHINIASYILLFITLFLYIITFSYTIIIYKEDDGLNVKFLLFQCLILIISIINFYKNDLNKNINLSPITQNNSMDKKPMYWYDPMEPKVHYKGPGKSSMNMELIPKYKDNDNQTMGDTNSMDKKPMYWYDPMEPKVHYKGPGKSSMNMELIPKYKDNDTKPMSNTQFKVPMSYVDNLGVQTFIVKSEKTNNNISTYAYLQYDEKQINYVTFYSSGWIKKLLVKASDSFVKKGQLLAQIFSPTIANAEEEYLLSISSKESNFIESSIKKLKAFHVSDDQISQLEKNKSLNNLINIYSPINGVIQPLMIREGQYITPETKLFSIIDLSSVWLIADIFENQANNLKVGNHAYAKFDAYPNKIWDGVVEFIYPELDSQSRTIKARVRFNNENLLLKPNMYGNVTIETANKSNVIKIPSSAVIRDDIDGDRVIISLGNGLFEVKPVVIGNEEKSKIIILSGLKLGDSVVTSGEFLLDSEANIQDVLSNINSKTNKDN